MKYTKIIIVFILASILGISVSIGCKHTTTPENTQLVLEGKVMAMYTSNKIGFIVYENGVAECRTSDGQLYLIRWEDSFIQKYNLKKWVGEIPKL